MRVPFKRLIACASVLLAMAFVTTNVAQASVAQVKRGNLTAVSVATAWPTLDPATDTQEALDTQILNAIYGQLFELQPDGTLVGNLATGYKFSNHNLTVTIGIRRGVKFQDGTPFTAQAVQQNLERVLTPSYGCVCDSDFAAMTSVTVSGSNVVLHLSHPSATIIEAFVGEAPNWVVSPTALASEGQTAFGQKPVGAGPFEVVSNSASSELVLKRFAGYWQTGKPGLNTLTFINTGSDESAISALRSGQAQLALYMMTPSIIESAKPRFNVCVKPGSTNGQIELNTKVPPFNNIVAREAVTYATNGEQLLKTVGGNFGTISKVPTGPTSSFYVKSVPGYRAYDLAKAKSLVQSLGGLSVNLLTIDDPSGEQTAEAIEAQWEAAGITVTIDPVSLGAEIVDFGSNSWEATGSAIGGNDPDFSIFGFPTRLGTGGLFSGVSNPSLDGLINKASLLVNPAARLNVFKQIYSLYEKEAYGPLTYVSNVQLVAAKSVSGICNFPVFAIEPIIDWENVAMP